MAKTNYNGTTNAGATKVVCDANAARTGFFFKNPMGSGVTMVLNFGAVATAANVLSIAEGESIYLTNSHKEPYEMRNGVQVFCASAVAYQAQAEE